MTFVPFIGVLCCFFSLCSLLFCSLYLVPVDQSFCSYCLSGTLPLSPYILIHHLRCGACTFCCVLPRAAFSVRHSGWVRLGGNTDAGQNLVTSADLLTSAGRTFLRWSPLPRQPPHDNARGYRLPRYNLALRNTCLIESLAVAWVYRCSCFKIILTQHSRHWNIMGLACVKLPFCLFSSQTCSTVLGGLYHSRCI